MTIDRALKNSGLDPKVAEIYEQHYDQCSKPCTRYRDCRTAREVAEGIKTSGVDVEMCLSGVNGVFCPYGAGQVIEELRCMV